MLRHLALVSLLAAPALAADTPSSSPYTAEVVLAPKPRPARPALKPSTLPLEFIPNERIALIGNGQGETLAMSGHFETLLHARFPQHRLVVRNFARPADEVAKQQRSTDYTKLDDPISVFSADTYLCFFGANESHAGPEGLANFKADYAKFLDSFANKYPRDDTGAKARFVLISPVAFEGARDGFLPDGVKENANLKLYAQAVEELAKQRDLAFAEVFEPTSNAFAKEPHLQFTHNGLLPNEKGNLVIAEALDQALFTSTNPAQPGSPEYQKLLTAVADKAWVHAQDHRMLNGWYVYGGRRTLDTETFPLEIIKIRNMVAVRDHVVWSLAQGIEAQPDDSQTGELFVPKTGFGTKPYSEPKELKYNSPEESIAEMSVPEGYEVQLVASEREFPEVRKINQVNFDAKGRLWAASMSTYPQWKPGEPRPSCKLMIFDDLDAKGRAQKMTVFYDKLICPTGFEFYKDGVIVVDEPRLIFLKDSDGDDKADVVIPLSDGWATDDTHHTIGAFEWSNGGLLHMLEGVSMSTAVETPWGPVRNLGSPGCYVLDPLTQKIRRFTTPGYGNPWCYVFDQWGQGFVGDGTTPQQHWDSPLSTAFTSKRKGLNTLFDGMGMRPNVGNEFILSRHFPDNAQGLFIYACVINMHGLTTFNLGDDGAGYKGARRKKTVEGKQVPDDLLASTEANFRPTDPMIGPDGALYFGDWHTALLGHMQYSQRDPNRDFKHGRLYRLVNKNKPLLTPVTQHGKSIPELLEQLKEYEPRTRYRARRELGGRATAEVTAAVKTWVAQLDATSADHDRLLCEALWVQQWHHAVDVELLTKVLRAPTGEARAAATRVLADEWTRVPKALQLMTPQIMDSFARTRLEAIRALSFEPSLESVELILQSLNQPSDYWIDYTLEMAMAALEPVWKPAFAAGTLAKNNPKGLEYATRLDHLSKPEGAAEAALKKALAGGLKEKEYQEAFKTIAKAKGSADNGKAIARRICIACHKFGPEGIDYGPPLNGVGKRLKKEEIVESIIEPNAKLDPKYVTTNIETKAGLAMTGFVESETAEAIHFKLPGGIIQIIPKADLQKRDILKQSSMPEGLGNTMSSGEFLDLVEFLHSLNR